jgi:hypothetical protein
MLESRRKDAETPMPSLVNFGITFAVVFAVIGFIHVPFGGGMVVWAVVVSAAFLAVTFTVPRLLAPLNRIWFRFGMLLHKIINPIVMGVIYFGLLVPMALVMRAFGKRFLRLGREPEAESYWIERSPPGPEPSSLSQQF